MKIIFLSHTSRNSTFKVGSYHLSNEAIKVHGVLYINPPISPFHYLKALLFKKYRTTIFKVKTEKPLIYTEENGIINYTPFKLFPFRKFYGLENIIFAEKSELSWMHRRKLRVLGYDKADLVIQDNLNLTFFKTLINCKKWIYRPTDDILSMPNQSKKYLLIENKVVNFSNQIFVTSTELKKIISDRYHRDCTVLHNGIDIKKLQIYSRKVPPIIKRLSNQRAIIVTYIGSLDQRFDFKLLTFIARMLPEHQFVIGGSSSCYFPDFPNVHEIGNVPYEEVGNYYSNSDYGILPFNLKNVGNKTRSPMKLYEMAAHNLNVISTPFNEILHRKHNFLKLASSKEDFIELLKYKPSPINVDYKDFPTWQTNFKKIINE